MGNKSDWTEKRAVSREEAQALADELGIRYVETSAKNNDQVDDAFFSLAREVKAKLAESGVAGAAGGAGGSAAAGSTGASGGNVNVGAQGNNKAAGGCC